MSAFLCSKKHILTIATIYHSEINNPNAVNNGLNLDSLFYIQETAKMLQCENVRSLQFRYPDAYPAEDLMRSLTSDSVNVLFGVIVDGKELTKWDLVDYLRSLLQHNNFYSTVYLLKQVQCYDYQACEHEGYINSQAYKIVQRCLSKLISALPDYNDIPWGIK